MKKFYPVLVDWTEEKRNALPTSGQYATVARFLEDEISWPSEAWSIVLRFREDVNARPCKAEARFLSDDAPESRLRSGARFELLEGSKVTARVQVL